MWRKGNACSLLVGVKCGIVTMENSVKIPQKTKNRTTISSNYPPVYMSEENENTNSKI